MSIKSPLFILRKTLPLIAAVVLSFPAVSRDSVEVPYMLNLGLGLGEVKTDAALLPVDQKLYTLKLVAKGDIEKDTLETLKDKLPKKLPSWLGQSDIGYSPGYLPNAIYFTDSNDDGADIFGFSYGPSLGLSLGNEIFKFGGKVGVGITYLYMDSPLIEDNHYFSAGVNTDYHLKFTPIKYLHFQIGRTNRWNFADELSSGEALSEFEETYAMLHIRIPLSTTFEF